MSATVRPWHKNCPNVIPDKTFAEIKMKISPICTKYNHVCSYEQRICISLMSWIFSSKKASQAAPLVWPGCQSLIRLLVLLIPPLTTSLPKPEASWTTAQTCCAGRTITQSILPSHFPVHSDHTSKCLLQTTFNRRDNMSEEVQVLGFSIDLLLKSSNCLQRWPLSPEDVSLATGVTASSMCEKASLFVWYPTTTQRCSVASKKARSPQF